MENRAQQTRIQIQLKISTDGSDDDFVKTILESGKVTGLYQKGEDITRDYLGPKFQSVSDMVKSTQWPEMQKMRQGFPAGQEPEPLTLEPDQIAKQETELGVDLTKVYTMLVDQQESFSKINDKADASRAVLEATLQVQKLDLAEKARIVKALERVQAVQDFQGKLLQEIFRPKNVLGNGYDRMLKEGLSGMGTLLGNQGRDFSPAGRYGHEAMISGIPPEIDG